MLAGIVAMQVEVLKLGATMGRAIERESALQTRNELLRDSVASLQDGQRIMTRASDLGMRMPSPGGVGFLQARGANAAKAAANIKPPDSTAFSAALPSNIGSTQTSGATSTSITPATATVSTPTSATTTSPSATTATGG